MRAAISRGPVSGNRGWIVVEADALAMPSWVVNGDAPGRGVILPAPSVQVQVVGGGDVVVDLNEGQVGLSRDAPVLVYVPEASAEKGAGGRLVPPADVQGVIRKPAVLVRAERPAVGGLEVPVEDHAVCLGRALDTVLGGQKERTAIPSCVVDQGAGAKQVVLPPAQGVPAHGTHLVAPGIGLLAGHVEVAGP